MSEVKKYDHSIFNHPGDEGSASSEMGKTYSSADDANESAPAPGDHEVVHRPGHEGSSGLTPKRSDDSYIQGCQNVPPSPLEGFLQGPDPMKTKVEPASGDNPYEGMPGAK